jgi:hypothetical protein
MADPVTCQCTLSADHGIVIPLGVDYGYRWPVTDATTGQAFDLTGWTAKMQIRNRPLPDGTLRATFTTDDALTTGTDGVSLNLEDTDTAGWTWPQGVYDIHLWNPSNEGPFFLVGGSVSTFAGVTEGVV